MQLKSVFEFGYLHIFTHTFECALSRLTRHTNPTDPTTPPMKTSTPFITRHIAWLLLLFALAPHAQEASFVEGGHYELLREAQPVQTADKIEVVEMFWYRCPHCYRLEPYVEKWRRNIPDNAAFVPVPAVLSDQWKFSARIYYTLVALGVDQTLHAEVFEAIHGKRRPLNTPEQFADWGVSHGIDRAELLAALNSFAVDSRVNFAALMTRKYGISGVPAIVVDGRYRTSVTLAGGQEKLFEVIDYLIELAAKERGS